MTDQTNQSMPTEMSPPTFGAARFAISVNAAEILISFGTSRNLLSTDPKIGARGQITEWLASYSLSATAVKQLQEAIAFALNEYTKRFGEIPKDSTSNLNVTESTNEKLGK